MRLEVCADGVIAIQLAAHINIHAKPRKETQSEVVTSVGRYR